LLTLETLVSVFFAAGLAAALSSGLPVLDAGALSVLIVIISAYSGVKIYYSILNSDIAPDKLRFINRKQAAN
jgi:predicted nicotinamide N-methyase